MVIRPFGNQGSLAGFDWVKRHDEYPVADGAQSCCHAAKRAKIEFP
jgi:hypothetical protein